MNVNPFRMMHKWIITVHSSANAFTQRDNLRSTLGVVLGPCAVQAGQGAHGAGQQRVQRHGALQGLTGVTGQPDAALPEQAVAQPAVGCGVTGVQAHRVAERRTGLCRVVGLQGGHTCSTAVLGRVDQIQAVVAGAQRRPAGH